MDFVTDVRILTGPPGCGKTTELQEEMLTGLDRVLFAMPRNDLIEERVRDLRVRAAALGISPVIVPIHSDQGLRAPVRRRLKDAALAHKDSPHVIVLISHEALKTSDLTDFAGWHVRIDEPPDAVASDMLRIPVSQPLFAAYYDLHPVAGTKWSKVAVRPDAPSIRDLLVDDIAGDLSGFHKQAKSSHGVYVDIGDWGETATRRKVQWWAAWTPLELTHFASIKIAGSGYFSSLLHLATEACYPGHVQYHRQEVGAGRTGSPHVRIFYFTRGHRASTAFWKTDLGRNCLNRVGRHLASVRTLGYWSGNEIVRDRFGMVVPGLMVSPKQAGTNVYRDLTSCAMIYSNKAQRSDDAILEVFGLSKADIERARQNEDIDQFIMRGAIRCPDFGGMYDIYLYDKWQAKAAQQALEKHGIAHVELVGLEDVGILDVERPRRGRKASSSSQTAVRSLQQRREADRLRKQRDRAEDRKIKEASGTLRGRGRPRKTPLEEQFLRP